MIWRRRMLNHPVCFVALSLAVSLALIPRPTDASLLPSGPVSASGPAAEELNRVVTALEQKAVATRLADLGLSQAEIRARLAALSDDELHRLASRVDQLEAGGDGAAGVLAAVVIFVLLVILILELLGRRIISRP